MKRHDEQPRAGCDEATSESALFAALRETVGEERHRIESLLWRRHKTLIEGFVRFAMARDRALPGGGVLTRADLEEDLRGECAAVWSRRLEEFDPLRRNQFSTFIGPYLQEARRRLIQDNAAHVFGRIHPDDRANPTEFLDVMHSARNSFSEVGEDDDDESEKAYVRTTAVTELQKGLEQRLPGLVAGVGRASLQRCCLKSDDRDRTPDSEDLWRVCAELLNPRSTAESVISGPILPGPDAGRIVVRRWRFWQNLVRGE